MIVLLYFFWGLIMNFVFYIFMKKGFLCKIKFYFVVCMWEVFYGVFFYCSNFLSD